MGSCGLPHLGLSFLTDDFLHSVRLSAFPDLTLYVFACLRPDSVSLPSWVCVTRWTGFLQEEELTKAGESGKAPCLPEAGSLTILEQGLPLVASGGTAVAPWGHFWNSAKPLATEGDLKQFFNENIVFCETDLNFAFPFFSFFFLSHRWQRKRNFERGNVKRKKNTEHSLAEGMNCSVLIWVGLLP